MKVVEDRIQHKHQVKYAKQVRAEKQKQKGKEKREHMKEIATLRKKRKEGKGGLDLDVKSSLTSLSGLRGLQKLDEGNEQSGDEGNSHKEFNKSGLPEKSRKRKAKDLKFGFGGKKRGRKINDAQSAKDMSSFDPRKNSDVQGFSAGEIKGKNKKGKLKRPGKSKRQGKKAKR